MAVECKVPELGENIETATVVEIFVSVGDAVKKDQSVLSLETDKAEFEMPSDVAGEVSEILVKVGDDVKVGQAVLRLNGAPAGVDASEESPTGKVAPDPAPDAAAPPSQEGPPAASTPVRTEAARREPDREEPEPAESDGAEVERSGVEREKAEARAPRASAVHAESEGGEQAPATAAVPIAAAPAVRGLARELGVDLTRVRGSGAGGRVLPEDVKAYVRGILGASKESAPDGAAPAAPELPDFSKWGPVDVRPMSKVRRKTAEQMARAWNSIPHVTHHDAADVTDMDRLRDQYAKRVEAAGGKLTMTAVLLKILASALRKFPKFNTSIDVEHAAVIYKKYVHLGVAVDTDKGLLVPVIRDVDGKNIVQIAAELRTLSEGARNRNIRPDALQGATFTLTNLGGIGGRAFSPLINPPEVAILGVSRARVEAVHVDGKFEPRLMMPLSLSYDHRVIDGADAARFLRWVCEALEEPFVMDLEGA